MKIKWKGNKKNGMQYGTLVNDADEILISATLPYILAACIRRGYEPVNFKEAVLAHIEFYHETVNI